MNSAELSAVSQTLTDERPGTCGARSSKKCLARFSAVERNGSLDYEVGPGASKLSGGQRQRLAVARMLLTDSKIVLADEATSALDMEGCRRIAKLIDQYAAGKTRIIVAHNLSTVLDADQILVLNKGQVMGCGSHEELKAGCPEYRSLLAAGEGAKG